MPFAWLRRNVFLPCEGGPLLCAIYLATLVWPISMPSLRSSPWILGAPHKGLAMLISLISRRISNGTVGRPQRLRDFQRQYDLKPARCQRMTVSGFTIVNALMASGTKRYSPTKIRRSMTLKATLFGFFVPQLAGQIYTMAGMVTRLNMRADNKKTLETLGLTIPAATLLRADEIIE